MHNFSTWKPRTTGMGLTRPNTATFESRVACRGKKEEANANKRVRKRKIMPRSIFPPRETRKRVSLTNRLGRILNTFCWNLEKWMMISTKLAHSKNELPGIISILQERKKLRWSRHSFLGKSSFHIPIPLSVWNGLRHVGGSFLRSKSEQQTTVAQ